MLQVVVFLALAFSIVIAIFAVQNTTPVDVAFLVIRAERVPVSVLVLMAAALGAGVMLLLGAAREISLRLSQRRLSRQLRTAERRVQELEGQPTPAPTASLTETVPLESPAALEPDPPQPSPPPTR